MIRILAVWLCALAFFPSVPLASEAPIADTSPRRVLTFPKDHGKHPDFQTEWWYFTGNLDSDKDHGWGFQLTFFRRTFVREPTRKLSAWAVRDLYPAHFAITDISNREFFHTELLTRRGPGLAHAARTISMWASETGPRRCRETRYKLQPESKTTRSTFDSSR